MGENILENVKEKFASARTSCPGMSEEVYALTDYISEVSNDELIPEGLVMTMALVMDDLQKNRNGFQDCKPLLEYLSKRREQVIGQIAYIPQIVDAIADEEFAKEFREVFKEIFGYNPPKRVNVESEVQYPENVRAAVDWWANAIQSPKFDNGESINAFITMMLYSSQKGISEEDLKTFKDTLALDIIAELQRNGRCTLSVDYNPCAILANAGNEIGLNDMTSFPWKTWMNITEQEVEVSEGYGAPMKTIWSKDNKEDMGSNPSAPKRVL